MSLAYSSVTTVNVTFGYGRHADTLSPERLVQVSLINYIDFTLGSVVLSTQASGGSLAEPHCEPK